MTNIIHIIDELKIGGAQTHLVTMLRHLKQVYEFEHSVISLFGDGPIGDELRKIGVAVHVLDLRPFLARQRFDLAIKEIKRYIELNRPQLVEAHLTWSRLLGLLAARLADVPQRIGFEQGDIYMNSLKFRFANHLSQYYTDHYIVCSTALLHWVQKTHHISEHKLSVFYNCVDTRCFRPDIEPAPDLVAQCNSYSTRFIMVGILGKGVNKRIDIGIQALAEARQKGANISLTIAGDGELRPSLEQLAEQLGIATHVHFLGMRHDIPSVLAASDVFCHASPFEPFGIVALEAMAVGCPVIVPDSGGIREVVQPRITGLVYPALDIQALALAMLELSADKQRQQDMRQAALEAVQAHFIVEQYVKRLYTLYGLVTS